MPQVPKISDLISENLSAFRPFKDEFVVLYRSFTRELPNAVHSAIRESILKAIIPGLSAKTPLKVRLTIDTNVIVSDSIRVAKGKASTTDKLFDSPYIEIFAPQNIDQEVYNALKGKLKDPSKLSIAISRAGRLLSKIKHVPEASSEALRLAISELGHIDLDDVPFLAISIDTGSTAIISQDVKAFDYQHLVKRWSMKDGANMILTLQEGGFAIVVTSTTLNLVLEAFAKLVTLISNAIVQITEYSIQLIQAFLSKSLDVLSKLPKWFLAGILLATAIIGLAALINESFRNNLAASLNALWDAIKPTIKGVIEVFSGLIKLVWEATKSFMIGVVSIMKKGGPYFLIISGVLIDRMSELFPLLTT
ncbi:MAG: hypothetical protein JRM72_08270 [Nitrososphaerota archaeon]|jgi:predicted nucleic acid-binding protein|nr:hypothetical protein [Nitrososphaerota archaeon]